MTKKKTHRRTVKVSSSTAVLSALDDGASAIKDIAKGARMTTSSVQQTLSRLRKKEPPQVKRTNKKGFAVIGQFKITASGRKALRKAVKELGV